MGEQEGRTALNKQKLPLALKGYSLGGGIYSMRKKGQDVDRLDISVDQGCQTNFHWGNISLVVAFKGLNVISTP